MPDIGIRLAIRAEGAEVRAYIARQDTMADPLWLSSIDRKLCEAHPEVFELWKTLMAEVMTQAVRDIFGETPTLRTEAPPDHEKAGSA